MRRLLCAAVAAALGAALPLLGAPDAFAAAPTNDAFETAKVIPSLPFNITEDTTAATNAATDPDDCSHEQSVWFSYTPKVTANVSLNVAHTGYAVGVGVYTGPAGDLTQVVCRGPFNADTTAVFKGVAGTTYHILIGGLCCNGSSGTLVLAARQVVAPANDDFANATAVGSLPFTDRPDIAAATFEPAEPQPDPTCTHFDHTVWYSFTPSEPVTVSGISSGGNEVALYTGTSLADLTQVACGFNGAATARMVPGTTYYWQVGEGSPQPVQEPFTVALAPDPRVGFDVFQGFRGIFEPVNFDDRSGDPAQLGIASRHWDFGDGTSVEGVGLFAEHQYARDGDYTVTETVTTSDGRSAAGSQVVQIRTHDISVVRISVPRSSRVNRTVSVDVFVTNTRYADTVRMNLEVTVPGGWGFVATSQQLVPVKQGDTTRFGFTYTITPQDAAIGKVSFRATATDLTFADALPADNVLISSPPTTIAAADNSTPAAARAL